MKLETNVKNLDADIIEELKFFTDCDGLNVVVSHREEGYSFFDNVTVNGRDYSFSAEKRYKGETERKRYEKRYVKLAVYKAVSDYTGEKLTWGALTGIRPVKYAYSVGENWRKELKEEMEVEDGKLDLVGRIIEQQKGIYGYKEGNVDLFIGVPFCPSRCLYCSFISNEIGRETAVSEYCDCVVKEIKAAMPLIKNLRSVYIGGGTPVSLPVKELEKILDAVGKVGCEFTVEAGRPDCIDGEKLSLLKDRGVTRICINPQTFNDKTLKIIGRNHTAKDVIEKFYLAKKYGFDINSDLIAGLPGESFEDFKRSIDEILKLSPENVTVHTLSVKRGSKLAETVSKIPAGDAGKMVDHAAETLISRGYEPYYMYRQKYMAGNLENTGYTKKGKACVYNIDVMEEIADNLACGANGVTKKLFDGGNRIERYGAPKDIKTYISKTDVIIKEKNKFFA